MALEVAGIPFSIQMDLVNASGGAATVEYALVDNPDPQGFVTVMFADMETYADAAVTNIQLAWKDALGTYYNIRTVLRDVDIRWQGTGMRQVSPVAGSDLVAIVVATGDTTNHPHVMVDGEILR